MSELTDKVLDACAKFVYDKEAKLIAKDGKLVWYATLTGRKSDLQWHSMTITEAVRVIKTTRLHGEAAAAISNDMLVQACQEAEVVYEYAVKSVHGIKVDGVFNYYEHANSPIEAIVCDTLAATLATSNYVAMLHCDVTEVYNRILGKLKTSASLTEQRAYFQKSFQEHSFELRMNSQRPVYDGKKQSAIMLPSSKPSHIVQFSEDEKRKLVAHVRGIVE